jgi:hypothetical protein
MSDVVLRRLAGLVRAEGGLLAGALRDGRVGRPDAAGLGGTAAAGPRAEGRRDELALVVEAVREGYLLHYGEPRLFDAGDRDLALLAGDRLYALGLARLAALGDLHAVAELADVISLCALAHAQGDARLADAAWQAGAAAVGWGASPELAAAKDAARRGEPGAGRALRAAARRLAGDLAPRRADGGEMGGFGSPA